MAEGRFQTVELPVESPFTDILVALEGNAFFATAKCPFCGDRLRGAETLRINPNMEGILTATKQLYDNNIELSDCVDLCMKMITRSPRRPVSSSNLNQSGKLVSGILDDQATLYAGHETQTLLHRLERRLEDLLCWAFMNTVRNSEVLLKLLSEASLWITHLQGEVGELYGLLCMEQSLEHQEKMASLDFDSLSLE